MSEWISVEERLPDEDIDTLLVAVTTDEPLSLSGESRFSDADGFENGGFCFWGRAQAKVTHWMPLPDPPA